MSIALSVNLNKVALLRNSRDGDFPSVEKFGQQSLELGADGLTVHPRPDQRHIQPADVKKLATIVREFRQRNKTNVEFNIEGNPFATEKGDYPGFIELVEMAQPHQCTLVPDTDEQKTSDHGFDLLSDGETLRPILSRLKAAGCRISLFMDPDLDQISKAADIGADRIELYTGPYADAYAHSKEKGEQVFSQHAQAAVHAHALGLEINAGHDLNLHNMSLYKALPHLAEVSIGHALTVDALIMGWAETIKAYLKLCR